jgi:hypothetical protein
MTPFKFNLARSFVLILTMWTMGIVSAGLSSFASMFEYSDATTIAIACCVAILLIVVAISGAMLYTVQHIAAAVVNFFFVTLVLLSGIGGFIYALVVAAPTADPNAGVLAAVIIIGLVNIAVILVGFFGALMSIMHLKQAAHRYTELVNN